MYTTYEILDTKYFLFPVSPFTFRIFLENVLKFFLGEFRPVGIGKKEFAIDRLPRQKIRKSPFTPRPYDHIGVRDIFSPQMALKIFFGDVCTTKALCNNCFGRRKYFFAS